MGVLTEYLKEEGARQRDLYNANREGFDAWIRSVDGLAQWMEDVVKKADPEKILEVHLTWHRVHEEGIGRYDIRGLSIRLGGRHVEVVPVGYRVVAYFEEGRAPARRASGRVDLKCGPERYILYRFSTTEGDRWVMIDDRDHRHIPLEPATFEAAVQRLLS